MSKTTAQNRRHRRWLREGLTIVAVIIVTLSARSSLADHYRIPTGSMEPTVHVGDRVVVHKAAYDLRLPFSNTVIAEVSVPSRGDIVVLDSPEQDLLLLKRVVAVPGDRVAVRHGEVWIDGARSSEEGASVVAGGGPELGETLVPKNKFLVLGDNRGDSHDGRSFGLIDRSAIRGKARAVYYSKGALQWRDL